MNINLSFFDRLTYYITTSIQHRRPTTCRMDNVSPTQKGEARLLGRIMDSLDHLHQERSTSHTRNSPLQENNLHAADEQTQSPSTSASERERRDRKALPPPIPHVPRRAEPMVVAGNNTGLRLHEPGLTYGRDPYRSTRSQQNALGYRDLRHQDRPDHNYYAAEAPIKLPPIKSLDSRDASGLGRLQQYTMDSPSQPGIPMPPPQQNLQRMDSVRTGTLQHPQEHASQRKPVVPSLPGMVNGAAPGWQHYPATHGAEQGMVPAQVRQDAQMVGPQSVPSQQYANHYGAGQNNYITPESESRSGDVQHAGPRHMPAGPDTRPLVCGLCRQRQYVCRCPGTIWVDPR